MEYFRGIVNTILYSVQFDAELDQGVADRIADTILNEPLATLTPEEEYSSLIEGLRCGAELPTLVQMRQSDGELREFLRLVVARMDSRRPWPTLPYLRLSDESMAQVRGKRPIARLALRVDQAGAQLRRMFDFDGEGGHHLLLRMASGIVIGLFEPYWDDSSDIAVCCADPDRDGARVVRELVDTGRMKPEQIFVLDDASAKATATRYETTPMHSEFHGEHLAGNTVWNGARVDYLDFQARQRYRLHGYDGTLHDSKGALFDTTAASTLWTPSGGRAIFVMDRDGNLYSAPFHVVGRFHPSSLLAGAPVAGAGEIQAVAGQVLLISGRGQHYQPGRKYTMQVMDSLRRQGLDVTACRVEFHVAH